MADATQFLIPLSRGPLHHFFGYYGVSAWDPSGTRHLALETTFHERRPTGADIARVGLLDAVAGDFQPFGTTPAFNLQQGSMMFWIKTGGRTEFTYNDWQNGQLVSQAIDPVNLKRRTFSGALAAVDNTHYRAVSLNYARMWKCRPVVGYDLSSSSELEIAPQDDGIWQIDLESGHKELIVSLAQVESESAALEGWPQPEHGALWFNHLLYSPAGEKLVFLTRVISAERDRGRLDSLWVMNSDGSELKCLLDYRYRISHFCWLDESHLLCSDDACGTMQFTCINILDGHCEPWGDGYMPQDGHACLAPNGQWIACDTYPGNTAVSTDSPKNILDLAGPPKTEAGRAAELFIYNPHENTKIILARPAHNAQFVGDIRCDLHPRWRGDGRIITVDSVHEGSRQIYGIDVSQWTN